MRKRSAIGEKIAPRLRATREAQRLSLHSCAKMLGINAATLRAIEVGATSAPSADLLISIARFVGLSLDELVENTGWRCFPPDLDLMAADLDLSYKEARALNIEPFRQAAKQSQDNWRDILRVLREHPSMLTILSHHPDTLATILRQLDNAEASNA